MLFNKALFRMISNMGTFLEHKDALFAAHITNRFERDKIKQEWNDLLDQMRNCTSELEAELNRMK